MKTNGENRSVITEDKIAISVPGRICLFGEHQDYLKLPVITAAINLRVNISGQPRNDRKINLNLPDINARENLKIPNGDKLYSYSRERDYFKSTINVLLKEGVELQRGCDCDVHGNIPINSGTSSSSALNVAWVKFVLELMSDSKQIYEQPEEIARLAYLAEVEEFGEPGGMMDHYATAVGGVQYIEFNDRVKTKALTRELGAFVLGDSLEAKDTVYILGHVKQNIIHAVKKIQNSDKSFNLKKSTLSGLREYESLISREQLTVLQGTLENRDITRQAFNLLGRADCDCRELGRLLNAHHEILDRKLNISTKKINRMLAGALSAGAYGGKINGSGGGGCMFAYAPENPEKVAQAIEEEGGKSYIIRIDDGIRVDYPEN